MIFVNEMSFRYLINEMGKAGEEGCIIEHAEDGMLKLKDTLRVVLYSTFAPEVKLSGLEAEVPKLSCYG